MELEPEEVPLDPDAADGALVCGCSGAGMTRRLGRYWFERGGIVEADPPERTDGGGGSLMSGRGGGEDERPPADGGGGWREVGAETERASDALDDWC